MIFTSHSNIMLLIDNSLIFFIITFKYQILFYLFIFFFKFTFQLIHKQIKILKHRYHQLYLKKATKSIISILIDIIIFKSIIQILFMSIVSLINCKRSTHLLCFLSNLCFLVIRFCNFFSCIVILLFCLLFSFII